MRTETKRSVCIVIELLSYIYKDIMFSDVVGNMCIYMSIVNCATIWFDKPMCLLACSQLKGQKINKYRENIKIRA